jgi:hypothetical protein
VYATYFSGREPGRRKMAQLERAFERGQLDSSSPSWMAVSEYQAYGTTA